MMIRRLGRVGRLWRKLKLKAKLHTSRRFGRVLKAKVFLENPFHGRRKALLLEALLPRRQCFLERGAMVAASWHIRLLGAVSLQPVNKKRDALLDFNRWLISQSFTRF